MDTIYLDHQAATPVDPRVMEAMLPYFTEQFENPHSNTYARALHVRQATENARADIAKAIHSAARDMVFTSGATESNNLAILGTARGAKGKRRRIVTLATEHHSVLEPVKSLKKDGFEPVILGVRRDGIVDLEELEQVVDASTLLVSVMLVNNETGVVQPAKDIAAVCQNAGALFHSDCAQALAKVPVDVAELGFDLASFSSHKSYGPKGIGALYVKNLSKAPIVPVYHGGGQEGGLRPGTLPVPLCVGLAIASRLAEEEQADFSVRAASLVERLLEGIRQVREDVHLNGHPEQRATGCLSITFPGTPSNALIDGFCGLAISSGAACSATNTRSSHVLKAMRCSKAHADSTVRLSIGRFTTESDIDHAVQIIQQYFHS